MQENENPQSDRSQQAQEALDKAAKIQELLKVRAVYYANRAHQMEEEENTPAAAQETEGATNQFQEVAQEANRLQEKTDQAQQRLMFVMRQRKMDRAA